MSSYVISKESYIRAAGYIAGLQQKKYNESKLYWYNLKKWHLYTDDEIIEEFTHIYDLNALSVQQQYDDPERENDTATYIDEFKKYKRMGEMLAERPSKLLDSLYSFNKFVSSVSYQIEDNEMNAEAMKVLNLLEHKIMSVLERSNEKETWGEFELNYPEEMEEFNNIIDLSQYLR